MNMTVPGHEDIYTPERPACNLSAMKLSASVIGVGAAWCDRTLMTRRRAVRTRSSPIASAVQSVMECQPTLHYSRPAAVAPDTTHTSDWKTVRGTERRMPRSWRETTKQADVVFMTWDLMETSASLWIPTSRSTRTGVIRSERSNGLARPTRLVDESMLLRDMVKSLYLR